MTDQSQSPYKPVQPDAEPAAEKTSDAPTQKPAYGNKDVEQANNPVTTGADAGLTPDDMSYEQIPGDEALPEEHRRQG